MADQDPNRSAPETRMSAGDVRRPILAYLADSADLNTLRAMLSPTISNSDLRRGNIRDAIRHLAVEPTPETLLVDVSGEADIYTALEELAVVCTPDVSVIVIGEEAKISIYRRLTREMAVSEYVYKPLSRELISRIIAPHLTKQQMEPGRYGGRVIAVCGARGGVGATTVAIAIARRLAAIKGHVALLDLHLRGGSAALMLGAETSAALKTALENPDRLDPLLIERAAIKIEERLQLIAANEPFQSETRSTPEGVTRLIALMRKRYTHIVVDLPNPPTAVERALLELARYVVVVIGPDIVSVRDGLEISKLAQALAPTAHLNFALNRADHPGGLTPALVAEGLAVMPQVQIPDMPRRVLRAANLGQLGQPSADWIIRKVGPIVHDILGIRPTKRLPMPLSALGKWR